MGSDLFDLATIAFAALGCYFTVEGAVTRIATRGGIWWRGLALAIQIAVLLYVLSFVVSNDSCEQRVLTRDGYECID